MKKYYYIALFCLISVGFFSCEDYFDTNPNTILKNDKFIAEDDEMFKGFLNIITKMQAAGDHAIFLTDTRGHYFDITGNTPLELQQIYNYEPTDGNPYADPACYYAIVRSCNDFIAKMIEYRHKEADNMTEEYHKNYNRLINSTLRIKVWTYMTIGKIYGEALWFDVPLTNLEDLSDTDKFTLLDMPGIIEKCLDLLDNGIKVYQDEVIPGREYETMTYTDAKGNVSTYNMIIDWPAWINPETPDDAHDYLNYMVPPSLLMRCELLSWRATQADYEWIRENILTFFYDVQYYKFPYVAGRSAIDQANYYFAVSNRLRGSYYNIFFTERYGLGAGAVQQNIAGIMYDYNNRQTNRIVEYFASEGSGQYYLRPSSYAVSQYAPLDLRSVVSNRVMSVIQTDTCFSKYFYNGSRYLQNKPVVEIQPAIPLYRGQDYHYLLAEAENNLGYWEQSGLLLNEGIPSKAPDNRVPAGWDSRYIIFLEYIGGYAHEGLVNCLRGGDYYDLPKPNGDGEIIYNGEEISEQDRRKIYDLALLDEAIKEYTGEGRSYAMMVRLAEKWNDPAIVADRVCPKYPVGERERIRNIIMNRGYWVDWNLKIQ